MKKAWFGLSSKNSKKATENLQLKKISENYFTVLTDSIEDTRPE